MLQKEAVQRRKTRKDLERERAQKQMEEGAPPIKKIARKKGKNIKRYVRPKKDHPDYQSNQHDKITSQLKLVMSNTNDTNPTTRLSTEPEE
tara:strand:- start:371 stop:643 length:273 start_codon:yes stop_codon:yes gene_type:complete